MLTRIGIKTNIDAMTASTFFTRRNKFEFSLYLAGWGADSGRDVELADRARRRRSSPTRGSGTTNRGRYSNPQVDELIVKAHGDRRRQDSARSSCSRRRSSR